MTMGQLLDFLGELFANVLNISITAAWIIPAILLLRLLMKKAPKKITCLLWAILALRLVLPFSFESALSLLPSGETIPVENIYNADSTISDNTFYFEIDSGVGFIDDIASPVIMDTSPSALRGNLSIFAFVWLLGVAVMATYMLISYRKIYRDIKEAVLFKDNIYLCDKVSSPFIIGIIRPKIILPFDIEDENREIVLDHEKAHLKRGDHLWKPLAFLLLSIHWFNPLMWVGYVMLCRDIELACDEKVIREKGRDIKKSYANALINCSVSSKAVRACPLAFGEDDVKRRIKSVLSYKKPTVWLVFISLLLCTAALVGFLTNPLTEIPDGMLNLIDTAVGERNNSGRGEFSALSYEILGTKKTRGVSELTVYMWVHYEDYSFDGELITESSSHILTAITGRKTDGIYNLVEYWVPEDGAEYKKSLEERLPYAVRLKAMYGKDFSQELQAQCRQMAEEYFGLSSQSSTSASSPYYPYSFMGKQYKGEKLVYDAGMFSSVFYDDTNIPQFFFKDMKLLTTSYSEDKFSSTWYSLGTIEELELTKENFDNAFTGEIWDEGYSAQKLREENLRAFKVEDEKTNSVHIVLEQKNSDIYIVKGYYSLEGVLRWIFKMQQVNAAAVPEENQIISAEKPYPYYLAVETRVNDGVRVDSSTDVISIAPVDFISLYSADGYFHGFRVEEIQADYITVSFASPMIIDSSTVNYCRVNYAETVRMKSAADDRIEYILYITSVTSQPANPVTTIPEPVTSETTTSPSEELQTELYGTVIKTETGRIYISVDESEDEYRSYKELYVSTSVTSDLPLPELKKGDRVKVIYDGMIQEIYPSVIAKPYSITKIEEEEKEMFHLSLKSILIKEKGADGEKLYSYDVEKETIFPMGSNAFTVTDEGEDFIELTFAAVVFGSKAFKPVTTTVKLQLNETTTVYYSDGSEYKLTYRITVADGYR